MKEFLCLGTLNTIAFAIRSGVIGKPRKIVHARIKCQSKALALLKGNISRSFFQLRIIALIYAGQHLNFNLSVAFGFS